MSIRKAKAIALGLARTGAETDCDIECAAEIVTEDRLALVERLREIIAVETHPAGEMRHWLKTFAAQLESEIRAAGEQALSKGKA